MRLAPIVLAGVLIYGAIPSSAFASDGVQEINQTCAVQTGCFPGDAAGFPVRIDGSAGRSYRLTSNLEISDPTITAIEVAAQEVAIDLNRFAILGPVVCSGIPPTCAPSAGGGPGSGVYGNLVVVHGTSITNGTIRGMGFGVDVGLAARIEGLRVTSNWGWGIRTSSDAIIENNIVTNNGGTGIVASASRVIGNTVAVNGSDGIVGRTGAIVRDNAVRANGGTGVRCLAGECLVRGNTITGNSGSGIGENGAYLENVIVENQAASVTPGIAMGPNHCDDGLCSRLAARKYYITTNSVPGDQASSQCDPNFHMASFWEISDPSQLKYDHVRGDTSNDSGTGAPVQTLGWIRSGGSSFSTPNRNCDGWSTTIGNGTVVWLQYLDETPQNPALFPWYAFSYSCNSSFQVWCIED